MYIHCTVQRTYSYRHHQYRIFFFSFVFRFVLSAPIDSDQIYRFATIFIRFYNENVCDCIEVETRISVYVCWLPCIYTKWIVTEGVRKNELRAILNKLMYYVKCNFSLCRSTLQHGRRCQCGSTITNASRDFQINRFVAFKPLNEPLPYNNHAQRSHSHSQPIFRLFYYILHVQATNDTEWRPIDTTVRELMNGTGLKRRTH